MKTKVGLLPNTAIKESSNGTSRSTKGMLNSRVFPSESAA
jgi:hypothetical protein